MRPSLLISLLALHLLVRGAQGIRLIMESSSKHAIIQEDAVMENSDAGGGEVILCNEENCLSGKIRKLMVSTTSVSTIKTAPKRLNDGADGGADAREKKGRKVDSGKDEDIMDMTEMDYSPAKRKPPIHN